MATSLVKAVSYAVLAAGLSAPCHAMDTSQQKQRRDPFKHTHGIPDTTGQKVAGDGYWAPDLRAIIYDPQQPLINIDGQIYGIGDSVEGYRVEKIKEREAHLVKDGRKFKVTLDRVSVR